MMAELVRRLKSGQPVASRTVRTDRTYANLAYDPTTNGFTLWIIGGGVQEVDLTLTLTTDEARDWRDFLIACTR